MSLRKSGALRIGCVKYLNAQPLIHGWSDGEVVFDHPAVLCGKLARADWAWSRDGARRVYVQDRVRGGAGELRRWVADGASVYVCGSLAGMAPGVDAALREVLGEKTVDAMMDAGRYRRDVY